MFYTLFVSHQAWTANFDDVPMDGSVAMDTTPTAWAESPQAGSTQDEESETGWANFSDFRTCDSTAALAGGSDNDSDSDDDHTKEKTSGSPQPSPSNSEETKMDVDSGDSEFSHIILSIPLKQMYVIF